MAIASRVFQSFKGLSPPFLGKILRKIYPETGQNKPRSDCYHNVAYQL